ncbi:TetR/AcrR family transcriptional regulator C-terminal domain-containing protein [bacterium 210820-DFI.6.37]|nr:TetR/AcrR family transcriptional regulator C-terminal domain-containing protein [bacterium 210820-DFI.6.37]
MKTRISDTFLALAKEKNIDRITVKSLIEECGISRQTFYYHFQNLIDVIEWSVKQGMEEMLQNSLKQESPQEAMKIFVSTTAERYRIIKKLLDSRKRQEVEEIIVQALKTYLNDLVRNKAPEIALDYSDMEAALDFYSYGITGLLLKACGKEQLDQNKLARQLVLLLAGKMIDIELGDEI